MAAGGRFQPVLVLQHVGCQLLADRCVTICRMTLKIAFREASRGDAFELSSDGTEPTRDAREFGGL